MILPINSPEHEAELVRVLIIDDHDHIRDLVRLYLQRYFDDIVKVVGTANSMKSAAKLLLTTEADLVFLDIDLTDGTGFEALDALTPEKREHLQVIVISTLQERKYVLQAMRYDAIDFLDKPVLASEFKSAVERAIEKISKLRSLKERLKALPKNRVLPATQAGIIEIRMVMQNQVKIITLTVSDIVYAQAARNYCTIVAKDGTHFMPSLPLKHYVDTFLEDGCVRIGRGYVVNPKHVRFYLQAKTDTVFVVLPSGEEISVEPTFRESVSDLL
jgi:two-component system LytT family response regulator